MTLKFIVLAVVLSVALSGCVSATQTTLFNVTISSSQGAPPDYYIAAVPGVAAAMVLNPQGVNQFTFGTLSVVSNSTGEILWADNCSYSGFGEGLGFVSRSGTLIYYDVAGSLQVVNAKTRSTLWRGPTQQGRQAFAWDEATGLIAVTNYLGQLVVVSGVNGETVWQTTLSVPAWNSNSELYITLSSQYIVVVNNGILFTLAVSGASHHAPLYQLNVSGTIAFLSGRYAIYQDTLVFTSGSNVSLLSLASGKVETLGALNTNEYNYEEVTISNDGQTLYILTVDGSFDSKVDRRRRRTSSSTKGNTKKKLGNNYPMFITANSVSTGQQLWEWFTDDTVSDLFLVNGAKPLICAVTDGGPVALDADTGSLVTFVNGGIDYMEPAPPVIYGSVWYFASMYPNDMNELVQFLAITDTLLI